MSRTKSTSRIPRFSSAAISAMSPSLLRSWGGRSPSRSSPSSWTGGWNQRVVEEGSTRCSASSVWRAGDVPSRERSDYRSQEVP